MYRNRVPNFDDHLMLVAAGLWNFYRLRNMLLFPNSSKDWRKFLTSFDELEKMTNYDFLSNVPKRIQNVIERNVAKL